jgi:chromosome segregation ATPase
MDQRIRVELREVGRQIGELRGEIDGLRAELHNEVSAIRTETASGFRAVERKIGILSKNLVDMTADIREIQDRLEQLETKPA